MAIITVPGRTELAGNHTDHQQGRALAGAIQLNLRASFSASSSPEVRIRSRNIGECSVRLSQLGVRPAEFGQSVSLVRGVLAAFRNLGLKIGGFDADISASLPIGVGLSSSAAFTVLIGRILNQLYNNNEIEDIVLARIAQTAENVHFGKPCGLMSHLVCAYGHTLYVDFKTNEVERIVGDFSDMGLALCVVNTGGSHAGLNTSYARIPADMTYIANLFDESVLADVDPEDFHRQGWDIANRPVRRAKHFFDENDRVPLMRDALKAKNGQEYMRLMNECGRSSEELLNNIVTSSTNDTRLLSGLEQSSALLDGIGAWRVHGGGFAGCLQAVMPADYFPVYKDEMEKSFGPGSCIQLHLI